VLNKFLADHQEEKTAATKTWIRCRRF